MSFSSGNTPEIEIQWGKERMLLPLPPPPATLLDLKLLIKDKTGLEPSRAPLNQSLDLLFLKSGAEMKLISKGFMMKQDHISLATYGLYDSDEGKTNEAKSSGLFRVMAPKKRAQRITLIASPETQATVSDTGGLPPRTESSTSRTSSSTGAQEAADESSTLARIAAIRDEALRAHLPTIEALEQRKPLADSKAAAYANELLLQALLAFDSFRLDPQWASARSARKEGVKTVQGLLDRLDQARGAA